MSNIIGATVRINTGKVEYVVTEQNEDGTYNLKGEKSSRKNVPAEKLIVTREADVEHATVEALETVLNAPQGTVTVELVEETGDAFDVRQDRRQSLYGLAILAQVFRKNPIAGSHNVNPLKPIGSTRAKVRARIKAKRTRARIGNEQYNTLYKTYNAA